MARAARRVALVAALGLLSWRAAWSAEPPAAEAIPAPVVGQPAGAWTLADVENAALEGNPTLTELQARLEATRGRWVQAGLPQNPVLGYSGQQLGSRGVAEQDGVLVQMEIVRLQKLRLSRAVAAEEIAIAEQQLFAQEQRVLTDARIGFYEVLTAQRRVEINEELVAISRQAVKTAEQLLNAKEVSRIDLLQARVESDQTRILLENARQRARAAWRSLAAVLGQPDAAEVPLRGEIASGFPTHEWGESLNRLMGASPEISVALAEIERARQAIARARVEKKPNLTVQGIVQHDNSVHSHNGALQVTFPIPVLNRYQGLVRAAESDYVAAEQNLRRTELDLQNRLAPVFERYAAARNQVARYSEDILPNAQESLDLAQAAYRAGEIGFLPLLTAQRTFTQTNLAYLEALRELWAASLEIDGLLLTGSLEARR